MKIAPIINTRTFNCDYNLVVKPSDFSNNDIKDIEKYILASSNSKVMTYLKGERWVVIDKGDYRIAGIVGFLKNICENCKSLSKEEKNKFENLFRDCTNRLIYSFIGIVIDKKQNSSEYIKPTYDYFWKLFVDNIEPIWNNVERTNIVKEFSDKEYNVNEIIEEKNIVQNIKFANDFKSFENKKVYTSDFDKDYELFKYYLNCDESNFSFCSNFSKFDNVLTSIFSIMTSNDIGQIEKKIEEIKKEKSSKESIKDQIDKEKIEQIGKDFKDTTEQQRKEEKENEKEADSAKSALLAIFWFSVLLFLIILFFLILR